MYRCSTVPPVYLVCSSSCSASASKGSSVKPPAAARSWCSTAPRPSRPEGCPGNACGLLGEAVGGALGRCRFEVVEVAGVFLELHQPRADMVEQLHRQRAAGRRVHALAVIGEVAHHLVQAVHADGGEVIAQRAEVALGVRVEPGIHVVLDHLALDLQALPRHV